MPKTFSISQQHYLFGVQTFAQIVLAAGGDEFHYTLYDRTTEKVVKDVVDRVSDLGVIVRTVETAPKLDAYLEEAGVEFHELIKSVPRIALPASHPMVNAEKLTIEQMADYPYIYFHQGEDTPKFLYEEAFANIPREKSISCTDRASLSELIVALNGYTVTSGILVGISDGSLLKTVPIDTDVELEIGYITRKGSELSNLEQKFVEKLAVNLEKYANM